MLYRGCRLDSSQRGLYITHHSAQCPRNSDKLSETVPRRARLERTYTSHSRLCTYESRLPVSSVGTQRCRDVQIESLVQGLHDGRKRGDRRDGGGQAANAQAQAGSPRRVRVVIARHTCARLSRSPSRLFALDRHEAHPRAHPICPFSPQPRKREAARPERYVARSPV